MLIKAKTVFRHGSNLVTPGATLDVPDNLAKRLICLKAAEEVQLSQPETVWNAPPDENPNGNTPSGENAQETPKTGIPVDDENNTMDRAYLETLSFSELKEIAKSFGVYSGTMRSKESVIEALTSISVSDDDDDLPDLTPQDVVEE